MLDYLPWIISGAAMLLAVMPLAGFARWRLAAAIFALGAGQIHLAVLALVLLLVVDNNWRIAVRHGAGTAAVVGALLAGIVLLTLTQETDARTFSELAQLGLYVLLFLLVGTRLNDGRDLMALLGACVLGSLGAALLAVAALGVGWVSAPAIFVARGANEGSVFLALLGVVPCAVMLTRTRSPLYLAAALPMVVAQYWATSRGSMAVSVVVLLVAGFLWTRSLVLRTLALVGGLAVLALNVPQAMVLFDAQLNSSAREQTTLLAYKIDLADERFWTS